MTEIRRDVVQALHDAIVEINPDDPPPLPTPAMLRLQRLLGDGGPTIEEHQDAMRLIRATTEALVEHRERQYQAWKVLIGDPWGDRPDNWAQVFDDLSPQSVQRLGELYDALPEGARAEYDRRYGRPEL